MKELGRKIRARRVKAGLSVRAVAGQIHKSHAWLSNLERGIGNPKSEDLTAIAVILGEDPAAYLRLAGRVNLAAAHVVPATEDMPAWASRLESKVDALSDLLRSVGNRVDGGVDGVASVLALLSQANGPRPGDKPDGPAAPRRPARRRRAPQKNEGTK